MAWETRARGTRYYTRSRKVNGRVIREYVGAGSVGEFAAATDALARADRIAVAAAWATERAVRESADAPLEAFDGLLDDLTAMVLGAAGFHRHHRDEWRRRRRRHGGDGAD